MFHFVLALGRPLDCGASLLCRWEAEDEECTTRAPFVPTFASLLEIAGPVRDEHGVTTTITPAPRWCPLSRTPVWARQHALVSEGIASRTRARS